MKSDCVYVCEQAYRCQRQNGKHRHLHNLVTERMFGCHSKLQAPRNILSASHKHIPAQIRLSIYIKFGFNIYSSCVSEHSVDTLGNILDLFCATDISSRADISRIHTVVAHRADFTQCQRPKLSQTVIDCWVSGC